MISGFQGMHRLEVRITRGADGKEGKAFVGKMTEDKAIEYAGKVVSEGFVYAVGTGKSFQPLKPPCQIAFSATIEMLLGISVFRTT